ncbi:hypothetical protein BBD42_23570 [Paenibacillus sp. BIHB 4019]|uniref:Uncharacterized protein n=1 Tax=Paenibacillus sp. BIHB 4019 TaxID=1870819 RepID=A0A1B2DN48_9BACL|nr:hypothetical protein [Paenibacillus sp. BIHB 4019]ANY69127.1 hypothetical protein BBD42_23570 [Paenibacillus sp. BIHB 4019]
MEIAEFEKNTAFKFAEFKKKWSGRGAIRTTFRLDTDSAVLVFEQDFTNLEYDLLDFTKSENRMDKYLKRIVNVMTGDFNPFLNSLHEGLQITAMKTTVEGLAFRYQITTMVFNKNLRQLVLSDDIDKSRILQSTK